MEWPRTSKTRGLGLNVFQSCLWQHVDLDFYRGHRSKFIWSCFIGTDRAKRGKLALWFRNMSISPLYCKYKRLNACLLFDKLFKRLVRLLKNVTKIRTLRSLINIQSLIPVQGRGWHYFTSPRDSKKSKFSHLEIYLVVLEQLTGL